MDTEKQDTGLILTERRCDICRTVVSAMLATAEQYPLKRVLEEPQLYTKADAALVRSLKPFFDFFEMVKEEKEKGIRHLMDVEDIGELYSTYWGHFRTFGSGNVQDDSGAAAELHRQFSSLLKASVVRDKRRPRILYIADCHFFHNRICREMDCRGFSGYEEMNDHMIRQWNTKVTSRDDVYILGDFSVAGAEPTAGILNQLNGKLHLIEGNHDKYLRDKNFDRSWFRSIENYKEIRDHGRTVILSHYPVFCYRGQYRRNKDGQPTTYMLYGHVHDTQDERLIHRFVRETENTTVISRHSEKPEAIPCNMINCFCMFSGYQPMTLDEWIAIDKKRRVGLDDAYLYRVPPIVG